MAWPYAFAFGLLGLAQLGTSAWLVARPSRAAAVLAIAWAAAVLVWALARVFRVPPDPDPWLPANSAIGFADTVVCPGRVRGERHRPSSADLQ